MSDVFGEMLRFELRQQLRSLTCWLIFVAFAAVGFLEMSGRGVAMLGVHDGVMRNAPLVVANALAMLCVFGILAIGTFVASAALRDHDCGTAEFVSSLPVSRHALLGGRFVAAWLLVLVAMLACTLGIAWGNSVPGADPASIGPVDVTAYMWAFGVIVVPGTLFVTALLFLIATSTRSLMATFIGVIVVLLLLLVSHLFMRNAASHTLAAMLDPFGDHTLQAISRYWTVDEINHRRPPLYGVLLFNRVLWSGIGLALLGATLTSRWSRMRTSARHRLGVPSAPVADVPAAMPAVRPRVALRHDRRAQWSQWLHWVAFDTRQVLRSAPFLLVLLFTLMNLALSLVTQPTLPGAHGYPVTWNVLEIIRESLDWLLAITVIFFAGELVWRDRDLRVADVGDALPWSGWVAVAAKCGVLIIAIVVFLACAALWGIGWQLAHGYTRIEPGLYLGVLALAVVPYILLAILCLALQVLCGSRFTGYLLSVLWLVVSRFGARAFGWSDHLSLYGTTSRLPHSSFDGFGPFLQATLWFDGYWLALGGALLLVTGLFWVRGVRTTWQRRWSEAHARCAASVRFGLALMLLAFVASGSWIFYNTHVLNHFPDRARLTRQLADYEKTYAHYRGIVQPRIADATLAVAIHPAARTLDIRGRYTLVNRHPTPIDSLQVWYPTGFVLRSVAFAPHALVSESAAPHFAVYRLRQPLAPGATMPFAFHLTCAAHGFGNEPTGKFLVGNGSFFDNLLGPDGLGHNVLPHIGYQPYLQLTDPQTRHQFGLPPGASAMAPLTDQAARADSGASNDADWMHFDLTLSTSADQIALSSGVLERTWTQGGRRYFHYVSHAPMPDTLPFVSARYEVRRATWKGIGIELYYDRHEVESVGRMMRVLRESLAWYITRYGPYPFRQLRVAVVPYNEAFAGESFPGLLVLRESGPAGPDSQPPAPGAMDPLYQLIPHEVSHQWWGEQGLPANVRGANMITESLAQYSALMLLKHRYGAARLQSLRRYLLDRYLQARHRAVEPESPLVSVGGAAQGYIYYDKGALAFYALADYVGEETVDNVLRQFVAATRFQSPPYPTAQQFLSLLEANVAPKWQPLISDLFRKITLFDNRMVQAAAKELPGGKYAVTLHVHAAEYYADEHGRQMRNRLNIPLEIGVFAKADDGDGADEKVLYLEKLPVRDGDSTFTIVVDGMPFQAGIDPFNELIDRDGDDNRAPVTMQTGASPAVTVAVLRGASAHLPGAQDVH